MRLGLRSFTDLTEHLKARADDDHAAPVTTVPKGTFLFLENSVGCQA